MGTGFSKKKKQARAMQDQLSKMQNQMQNSEFTGAAGNGLVQLTLSGDGDLKQLKIKPECVDVDDIEGLEDLIKAAHADAMKKMKTESLQAMPQGMPDLSSFGL